MVLLIATLMRNVPVARLAPVLVVLTAAAAIAGPNLAAPPAPWLFLFRILIVLLGLGLVGYLLMDGRLALPAALPRPAGLLAVWFGWTALSIGWADDVVAALRWTLFMAMMGGLAIAIALVCRSRRRAVILLWTLFGVFVLACLDRGRRGRHRPPPADLPPGPRGPRSASSASARCSATRTTSRPTSA